jgi:hypothetical protein
MPEDQKGHIKQKSKASQLSPIQKNGKSAGNIKIMQ